MKDEVAFPGTCPTTSAATEEGPLPPVAQTREVLCPRCHQQCGWCSDYRHMHGQLRLSGSNRRCTVPGIEPEGDNCPVCHGSQRVMATTTYAPLPPTNNLTRKDD